MKSFQQWKNEKQYFEIGLNPNAAPIPNVATPTSRGVPTVANPATVNNPTTINPPAATANNSTTTNNPPATATNNPGQLQDASLSSKFKRIMDLFKTLPGQKAAELLGAVDAGVAQNLASQGKTSIFKQVARGNIQGGREMLKTGADNFSNGTS